MREVFVHKEFARVGHYQSLLESAGIQTFMRNSHSHNVVAEIPIPALDPVLCVVNDEDYDRAVELIRSVYKPEKNDAPDWQCPKCNESIPGGFDSCWKCGGESAGTVPAETTDAPAPVPLRMPGEDTYAKAVALLRLFIVLAIFARIAYGLGGAAAVVREGIYPENALTPLYLIWATFSLVLESVALALCFFFNRIGRSAFALSLLAGFVVAFGTPGAIVHRPVSALLYLWGPLDGALLVMMYLSAASVYFEKKYQ